jgi:hypothetical protein
MGNWDSIGTAAYLTVRLPEGALDFVSAPNSAVSTSSWVIVLCSVNISCVMLRGGEGNKWEAQMGL